MAGKGAAMNDGQQKVFVAGTTGYLGKFVVEAF